MNEDDKELLIQTTERSKSNTHQIDEIKEDIKQIKTDQKAIYDLTSSVKIIADNIQNMKDDIKEVKQGQSALSDKLDNQISDIKDDVQTRVDDVSKKVDEIKQEPYDEYKHTKNSIKIQILSGIGKAVGIGLIAYICALIGSGLIKL